MRKKAIGIKENISFINPGDFELLGLTLFGKENADGKRIQIELPLIYSNFSVYEDINSPYLSGEVTIVDSSHLLSKLPIIGEETIQIFWRSMNTDISNFIRFRVVRLVNVERLGEITNVYTLELLSSISIRNQKTKVSKSFAKGSLSDMVAWVLENKLKMVNEETVDYVRQGDDLVKNKDIEKNYFAVESKTPNIEKYVAAYMSPIRMVNKLSQRSNSSQGSLFYFFEDISRFRFVNLLESISEQKKNLNQVKKLVYIPQNTSASSVLDNRLKWTIISDYKIKKRFDLFDNMSKGMYSSVAMYFDLEKRTLDVNSYYYQDDARKANHINNDGHLLTTETSDVLHNSEYESASTISFLVPVCSGDKESQTYNDQRKHMFQQRISSEAQLMNALIMEISIAGDTTGSYSIGKLIHIHIPQDQSLEGDRNLTGYYFITKIRHDIDKGDNRYNITMEVVSDTLFSGNRTELQAEDYADSEGISVDAKEQPIGKNQEIVHTSILSSEKVDNYNIPTRERTLVHKILKRVKNNV